MKTEEEHNFKFRPDFEEAGETYIEANLVDEAGEPIYIHIEGGNYAIDQAKQIIECMQAAIDKAEESQ